MKICKVCKKEYEAFNTTQQACSMKCALIYAREQRAKQDRKEIRERKKELKTKAQWMKEAQAVFNAYIRERDKNEPCISCGRFHTGQWHAGHYKSVGASAELRFHFFNNNKQCAPCNNHLSGNIVNYRPALIEKIGLSNVEWLESAQKAQKLTIKDIQEIKIYFQEQLKLLKNKG